MATQLSVSNVRIIVRLEPSVGRYPFLCVQVEEILIQHPDFNSVLERLRSYYQSDLALSITTYEQWLVGQTERGIEAIITLKVPHLPLPTIKMSEIGSDICSTYSKWLSAGRPYQFSPLIDLHLLNYVGPQDATITELWFQRDDLVNITIEIERGVKVISKSVSPLDAGDGEALLRCPVGEIVVYRERGYLRQGWTSLNLP